MTDPSPLVVFDLDGTLAETAGDLMGALNHVLSGDGLPPLPVAQALAAFKRLQTRWAAPSAELTAPRDAAHAAVIA